MSYLNVAAHVACTEVEGPGRRFALWVQGCRIRCHGCCNPEMLDLVPRQIVSVEDVWNRIDFAAEHCDIEGVTFLGGEPFLQARGLSELARLSRQRGLTVMVFTGYCIEGLRADPLPGAAELLEHTDLLVDGPYVASLADEERNWAGSSNQRFHFLTDRYRPGVEWDHAWANGLEVRVGLDGSIRGNGWPNGFSSSV